MYCHEKNLNFRSVLECREVNFHRYLPIVLPLEIALEIHSIDIC